MNCQQTTNRSNSNVRNIALMLVIMGVLFSPLTAHNAEAFSLQNGAERFKTASSSFVSWLMGSETNEQVGGGNSSKNYADVTLEKAWCVHESGVVQLKTVNADSYRLESRGEELISREISKRSSVHRQTISGLNDGNYTFYILVNDQDVQALTFNINCDKTTSGSDKPIITEVVTTCRVEGGRLSAHIENATEYNLYNNSDGNYISEGALEKESVVFEKLENATYTLSVHNDGTGRWAEERIVIDCQNSGGGNNGPDGETGGAAVLSVSCSVSPKQAETGEIITWSAQAHGGVGDHRFEWRGANGAIYSNNSTAKSSFASEGVKEATVYAYDANSQRRAARCSATVENTGVVEGDKDENFFSREIEEF